MPSNNNQSNRNYSIDLIKIIAMCMVVCLHTTHYFIESTAINIEYVLYNTSAIAIPLFFMVSGYLLIGRINVTYKYSFIKIWGIVRFMLIIIIAWWFIRGLFAGWNLHTLLNNFFGAFVQQGEFWMFWYFCSMGILYLIYPLINRLYMHLKYYVSFLILLGILENLVFSFNLVTSGESLIPQPFRIWNWLFYFTLGGMLKHPKLNKTVLLTTIVIALIVNIILIHFFSPYIGNTYCEYFYCYPIVFLLASSVFLYIKEINLRHSKFVSTLSTLFLPVYTIHPFVIRGIAYTRFVDIGGVCYFLTITIISIVVSWVLMKLPVVKELFKI